MAQSTKSPLSAAHDNGHAEDSTTRAHHLLVIGATRHTGNEVMRQGLAAGHTVTALARDPARIDVQHERLHVVRGDVLDPATLGPAIAGCDTVVSCLGATSNYRAPTTLYS